MKRAALLLTLAAAAAGCGETAVEGRPDPPRRAVAKQLPPGRLPTGRGYILARVHAPVLVYERPNGRPLARLRPTTPFGGPRTLGVERVRDKRRWLAIHSPVLGNGKIGWIQNDAAKLDLSRTRISLHVSLSRTRIELRRAGRTLRAIPIAIGAAGTSTPAGRFQITDKMPASRFPLGPYGCCVIALSARQPNLPAGWAGGDRIAIHGTPRTETIGQAASTGCLRASDGDLLVLMRDVPVGAPVFISS